MHLSVDQRRIADSFPDVIWAPDERLCVFRPEGILTQKIAARLISWLAEIERDQELPFSRFTDLTRLSGSEIREADVQNLAYWRNAIYDGQAVKSAILAQDKETTDLAHVYRLTMSKSQIIVQVFDSLHEAAAWLGLPPSTLERSS